MTPPAFGKPDNDAVIYKLRLEIKQPVRPNHDETVSETIDWMIGSVAKRELEKEIMKYLARLDGDVWDIEVMETEVLED